MEEGNEEGIIYFIEMYNWKNAFEDIIMTLESPCILLLSFLYVYSKYYLLIKTG